MRHGVAERLQLVVGSFELRGAFPHALLQLGVQPKDLVFRLLALGELSLNRLMQMGLFHADGNLSAQAGQ